MKRLLLAATSLVALSAAAMAADLPSRGVAAAPMYAAAPIFTWSGFYVGVNAGGAKVRHEVTDIDYWNSGATSVFDKTSFTAGGTVGFNLQSGSFVYGIEADANWLDSKQNDYGRYASFENKMGWFGTIRGRAGFSFGPTLAYVTAGAAFTDLKNNWGYEGDYVNEYYDPRNSRSFVSSGNRWGWVVGSGIEHAFTNNWSVKAEALYMSFESKTVNIDPTLTDEVYRSRSQTSVGVFRVGLNYRFGGMLAGAPVVARY